MKKRIYPEKIEKSTTYFDGVPIANLSVVGHALIPLKINEKMRYSDAFQLKPFEKRQPLENNHLSVEFG